MTLLVRFVYIELCLAKTFAEALLEYPYRTFFHFISGPCVGIRNYSFALPSRSTCITNSYIY